MPIETRRRLEEATEALKSVDPASEQAEACRRKQFAILEHALDAGSGFAPFAHTEWARDIDRMLGEYDANGLSFDAWVVMPNHLHVLTRPATFTEPDEFFGTLRTFKRTTAVHLNRRMHRRGRFWQRHWYDRWIRNRKEYERWLEYLQRNPVKAGLVEKEGYYPYMHIPTTPP